MLKSIVLCLAILLSASAALAQRNSPPSKAELAEITERGRQLAEYETVIWSATDAVMAASSGNAPGLPIPRKIGGAWTVVYGGIYSDKFFIRYEANQGASLKEFTVKKYNPPKEDTGFYYSAYKARETARAAFKEDFKGRSGGRFAYNADVLPAPSGQFYVYLVPAHIPLLSYPLGGDARYLLSGDGTRVIEKRQLHNTIIEFTFRRGAPTIEAFHEAPLDNVPEDTDVFYVLVRDPSMSEMVATRQYLYRIETDGTINYLMTMDEYTKTRNKQLALTTNNG